TKVSMSEEHDLKVNDIIYRQMEPGIYITEDDFSAYAIDVYSEDEERNKILSSGVTDLMYLPFYKHVMECGLLILGICSGFFSLAFVILYLLNKACGRGKLNLPFIQHVLNSVLLLIVSMIVYKTLSMTSYEQVKPFLRANIIYQIGRASCREREERS